MIKKSFILVFSMILLISCEISYEFPEIAELSENDLGEINAEKVMAFGDGYLAGVMDGSLYNEGQKNTVPSIIASQINEIRAVSFLQPDVDSETGYNFYVQGVNEIAGKWIYRFQNLQDENPVRTLTPGEIPGDFSGDKNSLNNLAVPQLSVKHLAGNEFDFNPYFSRISTGGNDLVEQLAMKSPTFVICWIGMNDYLKYAMNGAVNSEDLTTHEDFETGLNSFVSAMMQQTESKVILGNLISILDLPFFYLRQYNFIRLSNVEKASAQAQYNVYNLKVAAWNVGKPAELTRRMISFEDNGATLYPQPVVVIDNSLPDAFEPNGDPLPKYRQLTADDMALFSITDDMVAQGWGWLKPLEEKYYLRADELNHIEQRRQDFNEIIRNLAQQYPNRISVADLQSAVKQIADTGKSDAWGILVSDEIIYADGVPMEGGLALNSIFSLDAVHFNQRGNAFIAKEFIKSINATFDANIPRPEINAFIGNVYTY